MNEAWVMMICGVLLLGVGRQLFWLCVAVLGFLAGTSLAMVVFEQATPGVFLAAGILAGFAGALLALFVQKLAIGVAGFLGGGQLAYVIALSFSVGEPGVWLAYLVGGIIGTILAASFFDWAIIGITALLGAALITEYSGMSAQTEMVALPILALVGAAWQARSLLRPARERRT